MSLYEHLLHQNKLLLFCAELTFISLSVVGIVFCCCCYWFTWLWLLLSSVKEHLRIKLTFADKKRRKENNRFYVLGFKVRGEFYVY